MKSILKLFPKTKPTAEDSELDASIWRTMFNNYMEFSIPRGLSNLQQAQHLQDILTNRDSPQVMMEDYWTLIDQKSSGTRLTAPQREFLQVVNAETAVIGLTVQLAQLQENGVLTNKLSFAQLHQLSKDMMAKSRPTPAIFKAILAEHLTGTFAPNMTEISGMNSQLYAAITSARNSEQQSERRVVNYFVTAIYYQHEQAVEKLESQLANFKENHMPANAARVERELTVLQKEQPDLSADAMEEMLMRAYNENLQSTEPAQAMLQALQEHLPDALVQLEDAAQLFGRRMAKPPAGTEEHSIREGMYELTQAMQELHQVQLSSRSDMDLS